MPDYYVQIVQYRVASRCPGVYYLLVQAQWPEPECPLTRPVQWLVAQLIKHSTQNSAQPICAAGSVTGDLRLIVLMVGALCNTVAAQMSHFVK